MQILVFPYRRGEGETFQYAIFRRADAGYWQGIAGGGEDDESPEQAARRECEEEAGIPTSRDLIHLESLSNMPSVEVVGDFTIQGHLVIPQYCFGVDASNHDIVLSPEHTEYRWLPYPEARALLKWDSNKNALWELDYRLRELR